MLVAARAEQHERAFERQLREQQEEEYARSLAEDQVKPPCNRRATAVKPLCNRRATAVQPPCNNDARHTLVRRTTTHATPRSMCHLALPRLP